MKIVAVTNELLNDLRSIGFETYHQHFSNIWSEEGINSYLESHFNIPKLQADLKGDVVEYFLVFAEEALVGFFKLKKAQPVPNTENEYGLEIEKIYLLQDFASKGLGKQMIDFVIDYAKNLQEKSVWLDALKINEKAIRFYERQGFQIIGELDLSTDIMKPDLWVMQRKLD